MKREAQSESLKELCVSLLSFGLCGKLLKAVFVSRLLFVRVVLLHVNEF